MCGALLVGALTTLAYGLTESLVLLLLARAAWGACWSVLRLSGLITVTDCIDAGLAPESRVGRLTGFYLESAASARPPAWRSAASSATPSGLARNSYFSRC